MSLAASDIITRACVIAKAPGYRVQAGTYLNMMLDTLQQTYDFDYISKPATINIRSGVNGYALPADHMRTREVFYNVNGSIFYLNQVDIRKFNSLFNGPGVDNYPYQFSIDVSTVPHTLLFYPPPAISLPVKVIYFPRTPDIASPETSGVVPWFLTQEYLIDKTAAYLMRETEDDRYQAFDDGAEKLLRSVLIMDDDKEGYPQTVKLSRQNFRPSGITRPSKAFPLM
jgi:hypothetical protein